MCHLLHGYAQMLADCGGIDCYVDDDALYALVLGCPDGDDSYFVVFVAVGAAVVDLVDAAVAVAVAWKPTHWRVARCSPYHHILLLEQMPFDSEQTYPLCSGIHACVRGTRIDGSAQMSERVKAFSSIFLKMDYGRYLQKFIPVLLPPPIFLVKAILISNRWSTPSLSGTLPVRFQPPPHFVILEDWITYV